MENEKIFAMSFRKVYTCLVNKAVRKGKTEADVDLLACRFTGRTPEQLAEEKEADPSYGDFFRNAPCLNPKRTLIKGSICGVKLA